MATAFQGLINMLEYLFWGWVVIMFLAGFLYLFLVEALPKEIFGSFFINKKDEE